MSRHFLDLFKKDLFAGINLCLDTQRPLVYPAGMKTSQFIKEARERLGITQTALGDILGITKFNISKYENGWSVPPGTVILKVTALLDALPAKTGEVHPSQP